MTENTKQALLRKIPKVDDFLSWLPDNLDAPESVVKDSVRQVLDDIRKDILSSEYIHVSDLAKEVLLLLFEEKLKEKTTPKYRPVINATGVVIHTNLGRSLLPQAAMDAINVAGKHYGNLEFNLATGERGSRYSLVEELICQLTGAEAALVVNNNAAAVLLVLSTLAIGKEVIVSRGQLVEIGGSFRIPDVMEKSGARLVDVGATNRTHLQDYENAITENTGLLLKVHTSNYRMIGFTSEVSLAELVSLGEKNDLPVMEDLGSGCLIDLTPYGFSKEPTVSEALRDGVDVVTFSGDKMLGGPQAGLILGKRHFIDRIKKNPMNRALRIDKFTLAGLEAIFRLYLDEEKALSTIPTLAMLTSSIESIGKRADKLRRRIRKPLAGKCSVGKEKVDSRVGGGALPEEGLASWAVTLHPAEMHLNEMAECLRRADMPLIGRIEHDQLILDMRTVLDEEIPAAAKTILEVLE